MKPAYLHRLTLRQIEVFLAVCRHLSYSRAAEELALTQPAVSAQMRQLEELVGEPLFDYLARQLYLTAAGEMLERAGRDLQQRLVSLEMELAEQRGMMRGALNLAIESSAQYFLPAQLARFCRTHPSVELQLRVMNHAEVQKSLQENRADLVVMGLVPEDRALAFIPFRDNELIAVAAADHSLLQPGGVDDELTLLQLLEETLLVREPGSGTRRAFDSHCAAQGARMGRLQQLGSLEAIRAGVEAGFGVAVLPRDVCARELATGALRELRVRGLPLRRSWCAVYPRAKHLTPVAQAFLNFLTG